MFYDNFVVLCAKHGKSPSGVAREIGLSNAAANGWKKGKIPNDTTLAKLSTYFDVPISELIGAQKKTPLTVSDEERLDQELIMRLCQLSPEELEKVDAFVQGLLAAR